MNYQKMEVAFPRKLLLELTKIFGIPQNEAAVNRIRATVGGDSTMSQVRFYLGGDRQDGKKLNSKAGGVLADKKLYWRPVDAQYVEAAAIYQLGFIRKNDKDWMTGQVFPLRFISYNPKTGVVAYEIMHAESYNQEELGYAVMVTSRKNNVEKTKPLIRDLPKRVGSNKPNVTDEAEAKDAAVPEVKPHPIQSVIHALAIAMKDHANGVLLAGKMSGNQIGHIQDTLDDVLFAEVNNILEDYIEDYKTPKAAS